MFDIKKVEIEWGGKPLRSVTQGGIDLSKLPVTAEPEGEAADPDGEWSRVKPLLAAPAP